MALRANRLASPFSILPEDEEMVTGGEVPLPDDPTYGTNPPADPEVFNPEPGPLGTNPPPGSEPVPLEEEMPAPVPPGPVPAPVPYDDGPGLGTNIPEPPVPLAEPPVVPLPPAAGTPTGIPGTFGAGKTLSPGLRTPGFNENRGGRVRPMQFGPGVPNVAPSGFESANEAEGVALSDDELLRSILKGKRGR